MYKIYVAMLMKKWSGIPTKAAEEEDVMEQVQSIEELSNDMKGIIWNDTPLQIVDGILHFWDEEIQSIKAVKQKRDKHKEDVASRLTEASTNFFEIEFSATAGVKDLNAFDLSDHPCVQAMFKAICI
jgi:hypothetical protein